MEGGNVEGHDAGYVPENPGIILEHYVEHNVRNVIGETANFDAVGHDVGNLQEDSNFPNEDHNNYDLANMVHNSGAVQQDFDEEGVKDVPDDSDVPQSQIEENDAGNVPENSESLEKPGSDNIPELDEGKRWPGWPGENVFRMLVPVQKVGSIIGRKGEFIKKITEETKARIKILDGPSCTSERAVVSIRQQINGYTGFKLQDPELDVKKLSRYLVMVSAKEEPDRAIPPALEGLLRVHKQIVNVDRDSTNDTLGTGRPVITKILVADTQARSLIGKQGSTIKAIQDSSNCAIRVLGSERLPIFALRDDSLVEIQGEAAGVHKAVELIAGHLRKFLVDRSVIGLFESQMQAPDVRPSQNTPPQQPWGPPQCFPSNTGVRPGFPPNIQYMPPPHQYDNYYLPTDIPHMDKPHHQGPSAYARDASLGGHSSTVQSQRSVVAKITQQMQIPLSYADAVIGTGGKNISYIRRASGASIAVQETLGVPGQMTVEMNGTASEIQAAQQLVHNFMAEAASSAQDRIGGAVNQAYKSFPVNAPVYASPPSSAGGHTAHAPAADYGPVYGAGYGY